jgi:hypothetical protein
MKAERLGTIVDFLGLRRGMLVLLTEADRDLDPIARGLEAIAVGYSLRFPDDLENLAHQFDVYDALYAWCRLQAAKGG